MIFTPRDTLLALAGVLALAPAAGAQAQAWTPQPGKTVSGQPSDIVARIPGRVLDLARTDGGLLYSTQDGEVGIVTPGVSSRRLASPADGLPNALFGVAALPSGDVATLNVGGDIWIVPQDGSPVYRLYRDTYMIEDARDLVVDAQGNFLIASKTPSSGVRAVNHVSFDGQRWSYFTVMHQPVALAFDPMTGGLLFTDTAGGGALRWIDFGDETRPITNLVTDTPTFPSVGTADGDIALESDGDVLWTAGGNLWRHDRSQGTTAVLAGGFQQLRGVAIAPSSGLLPSLGGWSAYVAEGEYPTRIREITGVDSPAPVVVPDTGWVPGPGRNLGINPGFQIFDLAADNHGHLLLGGGLWNQFFYLKRVVLPVPVMQSVADDTDGLAGMIEGVAVAPDDTIFAVTREGTIHSITENPLAITDVFTDPGGQIAAAKDLALDVDGTLYVAERSGWGWGKLLAVDAGVASLLALTDETRGLAARPGGGMYVSQWHGTGFEGSVSSYSFQSATLAPLPGFATMNYTNDSVWGDGDLVVDSLGRVYTVSEDDWSLVRYTPGQTGFARIGSGYLDHPSGLVIAPSSADSGSATGWSLYISDFNRIWEKIDLPGRASPLVDSTVARLGASVGTLHPRYGRPLRLAIRDGGEILVGTSGGYVLALDGATGEGRVLREGRPTETMLKTRNRTWPHTLDAQGKLYAARPDDGRIVRFGLNGERQVLSGNHVEVNALAFGPSTTTPGESSLFVIDGWSVLEILAADLPR